MLRTSGVGGSKRFGVAACGSQQAGAEYRDAGAQQALAGAAVALAT
jgi:hypothetical protein